MACASSDWLKHDGWFSDERQKILKIWADAKRPYKVGHGVDPAVSREKGRVQPAAAAKENQRQKDLGWDV